MTSMRGEVLEQPPRGGGRQVELGRDDLRLDVLA
jgi:hypothetical protein